jgi:two-component system OmpR family response regulator
MGLSLSAATNGNVYRFGNVAVDFASFEVRNGETVHSLTTMEMQLLRYFIQHEGVVLSRSQLLRDVWDEKADLATRSIDNFVMRLRKFIEPDPANPVHLLSVRGTGYRFISRAGDAANDVG